MSYPISTGVMMFAAATYVTTDPDEYAAVIHGANVEIVSVGRGPFNASVTRVDLGRVWMQRGGRNLPSLSRSQPPEDHLIVSFLRPSSAPWVCETKILTSQDLALVSPGKPVSTHSLGRTDWAAMSLRLDDFIALARTLLGREPDVPKSHLVLRPPASLMCRLQHIHEAIVVLAETSPEALAQPAAIRGFEQSLFQAMLGAITSGVAQVSDAPRSHAAALARFQELVQANPDSALYMTDVCAATRMSGRTLRFICSKYLGMSPHHYLHLRRLHLARRALLSATTATRTVTGIATSFGFWELGRFAVAYRELFGESPLATLRAPPDRNTRTQPLLPCLLAKSA